MIDVLAFDADDTLWHNETLFRDAQAEFRRLLARYHDEDWIEKRLYETEVRNLTHFGYGVKSFMLSMIETAIELTEGRIEGPEVQRILALGREIINAPIRVFDGVVETLDTLSRRYDMILITKGDLLHQESKIEASGLRDYFSQVEVVSRKEPVTYQRILERHRIDSSRFGMVGDSMKSDVLPVLSLGGWAFRVPNPLAWQHEHVDDEPTVPRYVHLESLSTLPGVLERLAGDADRSAAARAANSG
jgi:putative hydrolase of the HAD superfamily